MEPIITKAAEADMLKIYCDIGDHHSEAAERWVKEFYQRAHNHANNPGIGRSRSDLGIGFRTFVVGRYVAIFQPVEDTIRVLRVIHGSRDIPTVLRSEND